MNKHLLAIAIIVSMIGLPAFAENKNDRGLLKETAKQSKQYSRDKYRVEKDHRKHYKNDKHSNKQRHDRKKTYADYKYGNKHNAKHNYKNGYKHGYKQAAKHHNKHYKSHNYKYNYKHNYNHNYKNNYKHNYKNRYKNRIKHHTSYNFNTYPQVTYRYNSYGKAMHGEFFYDYGSVNSVTPIFETVEQRIPRSSCSHNSHGRHSSNSATPAIIGGIIGAAIGNELGHNKRNKQVGAVAGGILGASIGSDLKGSGHRCVTQYDIEYHEQVVGFDVSYNYQGRTYYTKTTEHPGNRIQLKLRVDPVVL